MSFVDYDEELAGEAPCEFCGDSYPLFLLIEHQTTHLDEGYPAFDNPYFPEVEDFPEVTKHETASTEPIKEEDKKQTQSFISEPAKPLEQVELHIPHSEPKKEANPVLPPKAVNETAKSKPKEDTTPAQPLETSNKTTETKKNQYKEYHSKVIEEFTTKKGEKLLVYGANIEPVDDLESEKQSYKMPNNPLLNTIPKEEDVIDINSLSDDDGDESLEEFWRRARDFLKRNKVNR